MYGERGSRRCNIHSLASPDSICRSLYTDVDAIHFLKFAVSPHIYFDNVLKEKNREGRIFGLVENFGPRGNMSFISLFVVRPAMIQVRYATRTWLFILRISQSLFYASISVVSNYIFYEHSNRWNVNRTGPYLRFSRGRKHVRTYNNNDNNCRAVDGVSCRHVVNSMCPVYTVRLTRNRFVQNGTEVAVVVVVIVVVVVVVVVVLEVLGIMLLIAAVCKCWY